RLMRHPLHVSSAARRANRSRRSWPGRDLERVFADAGNEAGEPVGSRHGGRGASPDQNREHNLPSAPPRQHLDDHGTALAEPAQPAPRRECGANVTIERKGAMDALAYPVVSARRYTFIFRFPTLRRISATGNPVAQKPWEQADAHVRRKNARRRRNPRQLTELPHAADRSPARHFSGLSTGFQRDRASWRPHRCRTTTPQYAVSVFFAAFACQAVARSSPIERRLGLSVPSAASVTRACTQRSHDVALARANPVGLLHRQHEQP